MNLEKKTTTMYTEKSMMILPSGDDGKATFDENDGIDQYL
jgi:hypothetical protein